MDTLEKSTLHRSALDILLLICVLQQITNSANSFLQKWQKSHPSLRFEGPDAQPARKKISNQHERRKEQPAKSAFFLFEIDLCFYTQTVESNKSTRNTVTRTTFQIESLRRDGCTISLLGGKKAKPPNSSRKNQKRIQFNQELYGGGEMGPLALVFFSFCGIDGPGEEEVKNTTKKPTKAWFFVGGMLTHRPHTTQQLRTGSRSTRARSCTGKEKHRGTHRSSRADFHDPAAAQRRQYYFTEINSKSIEINSKSITFSPTKRHRHHNSVQPPNTTRHHTKTLHTPITTSLPGSLETAQLLVRLE